MSGRSLTITGVRFDEPSEILDFDEAADAEKIFFRQPKLHPKTRCIRTGGIGLGRKIVVVHDVPARKDALLGHTELGEVLSLRCAGDQTGRVKLDQAAFDPLAPPMALVADGRAVGEKNGGNVVAQAPKERRERPVE